MHAVPTHASAEEACPWLDLAARIQRDLAIPVVLHVTCHCPAAVIRRVLSAALRRGICNILAVRGDPLAGGRWKPPLQGFRHAVELVRLARAEHGAALCIGVAGYPEVHTEAWNSADLPPSERARAQDLRYTVEKVAAGADFLLTQFVYDTQAYKSYVGQARAAGIRVPIIPGYMPVTSHSSFAKFCAWCRTAVPPAMAESLTQCRGDDAEARELGVEFGAEHVADLLHWSSRAAGSAASPASSDASTGGTRQRSATREHTGPSNDLAACSVVHFFTMNIVDPVLQIAERAGLTLQRGKGRDALHTGAFVASDAGSSAAGVQPIFWVNRAAAYAQRTAAWSSSQFPNGRWGKRDTAAYGELNEYYLASKRPRPDRAAMWGTPRSMDDIAHTFTQYIDGSIPELPWADAPLSEESEVIRDRLRWLNRHHFFTVNSQPKVNALSSSDPTFGWGPTDGHVFQKAYLEFFCPPSMLQALIAAMPAFPSLTFHARNAAGQEHSNAELSGASAVTWGVFPGREVLQTTVVDPAAFRVWASEAFSLWLTVWADAYDETQPAAAKARTLLQDVHDSYFLVNIVDHDYVSVRSDIFAIFHQVVSDRMTSPELRARVKALEADNAELRDALVRMEGALASANAVAERALVKAHEAERELEVAKLQAEQHACGIASRPLR